MSLLAFKFMIDPFQKSMELKGSKLKKRRDTNAKAVAYLDKWIQDNFKSQGSKSSKGKWAELSDVTLMMRRKEGKGAKILEDIGNLKGRWKHLYTHSQAAIQSGLPYALVHDQGNPRNRMFGKAKAPIPQRKITPEKEQVWPNVKKIYRLFLNKVLK